MDTNSHLLAPIWAAETEVVVTEPQGGFRYYGVVESAEDVSTLR